jgi:hypothetical protein
LATCSFGSFSFGSLTSSVFLAFGAGALLHRLAVLGQLFQFRFELGAACGDLLEQLVAGILAQTSEFFDA